MKDKRELINRIKEEIPYVDIKPYSHNIINLLLETLSENYGDEEVLKVIRTTALRSLGWGEHLQMTEEEREANRTKW